MQGLFSTGDLNGFIFTAGSVGGGNITTAGTGDSVNINDATHGLIEGDYINVQSANHSGTVRVTYIDADNIQVKIAFVGNEAGTWQEGDYLTASAGTAGKYLIQHSITGGARAVAKEYKFELVQNATHLDNTAFDITTSGTLHQSGAGFSIITVTAGDRFWLQLKNQTDTQAFEYQHSTVVIHKL